MKNLTISFSGYNIKNYLQLAIKSLLYFHPEVKECIVVFDDNSTDGTKEWLEENGIKRITWSGKYDDIIDNLTLRINYIYREIFEQCNTKYLFNLDGDIIFINKFMNLLEYHILNNDIIGYVDTCGYISKNTINKDIFKKYSHLSTYDIRDIKTFQRIWPGFMYLNLDKFKAYDIIFDNHLDLEYNNYLQDGIDFCFDSGVDMYHNVISKDFKLHYLNNTPLNIYYHFCGKSVLERSYQTKKDHWSYGKNNDIPKHILSLMDIISVHNIEQIFETQQIQ